nr:probable sphingolipid transporter spinster homolog 2 [Tanacetum cinerariifolium]
MNFDNLFFDDTDNEAGVNMGKRKKKSKSKSTNGQFGGPSVKQTVRYEPKATTSAPNKRATNVGNSSKLSSMTKTTITSTKKGNIAIANPYSALEDESDEDVENIYDESANLFQSKKPVESLSTFTATAPLGVGVFKAVCSLRLMWHVSHIPSVGHQELKPSPSTSDEVVIIPVEDKDMAPSWFTPKRLLVIFCVINMINYVDRGAIASNGVNGNPRLCTKNGVCSSPGSGIHVISSAFMVGLLVAYLIFTSLAKRLDHPSIFCYLPVRVEKVEVGHQELKPSPPASDEVVIIPVEDKDMAPSWFTPKRLLVLFYVINMINYVDRGAIASNGVNGNPRLCTKNGVCSSPGSGIQ